MEEEEEVVPDSRPVTAIFRVQLADLRPGQLQQQPVVGHRFLPSVAEIGQQAEMQALIAIRQEADFQRLGQILHSRRAG